MNLSHHQKNYIRKNIKNKPLKIIAQELEIKEEALINYLKNRWGDEKFNRFVNRRKNQLIKTNKFSFYSKITDIINDNKNYFLLLFLLASIPYLNAINNDFVSDDIPGILNNPQIGNPGYMFSVPFSAFMGAFLNFISYSIGELSPAAYRLPNILFHIGSVFELFILLFLIDAKRVAFIASAIFAVHPILTESITWISGGPYSRYAFFFLASFVGYILANNKKKYYYYSIGFFVLSLLSSTNAVVLFLIFPIYEFWNKNLLQNWKKILPYFSLSLFALIFFFTKIGTRANELQAASYSQTEPLNPLIQIPIAVSSYLELISWPNKLSLYQTEMSFSQEEFLIKLLIFLSFLSLLIFGWQKKKKYAFWLLFFIIPLLPTLTPLGISWIVAERYAYLSSIGIFVAIAFGFDWIIQKTNLWGEKWKIAVYSFILVIILSLSIRTIIRNTDWKNEDNLWFATAKVSPSGPMIHNNLGDVYSRQGNYSKAIEEFKKAIEINPNYADAIHNLGNAYRDSGQTNEAIESYAKALEINPNIWQSHQNLASIYFERKDKEKALEHIQKAINISPDNESLKKNLAIIQSQL